MQYIDAIASFLFYVAKTDEKTAGESPTQGTAQRNNGDPLCPAIPFSSYTQIKKFIL